MATAEEEARRCLGCDLICHTREIAHLHTDHCWTYGKMNLEHRWRICLGSTTAQRRALREELSRPLRLLDP